MNRRRFIVGLMGGSVAGGTVLSTGAFSSVEADRNLSVEVAPDSHAYLRLEDLGGGKRSVTDDREVELSFPGLQERLDDSNLGLGTDSVYEFVYDAEEDDEPGLIRITNQGTSEVVVYSEHETTSEIGIEMFDVTDPKRTALQNDPDPEKLAPGSHVDVGFRIETFGSQSGTFNETLTIVAEAPEV